jgi:hypothetical protein
LSFLDENKKTLHYRFAFNSNNPYIKYITEKKYKIQREKINQQEPINKSRRISKYF